jgi:hypothetical protein
MRAPPHHPPHHINTERYRDLLVADEAVHAFLCPVAGLLFFLYLLLNLAISTKKQ